MYQDSSFCSRQPVSIEIVPIDLRNKIKSPQKHKQQETDKKQNDKADRGLQQHLLYQNPSQNFQAISISKTREFIL